MHRKLFCFLLVNHTKRLQSFFGRMFIAIYYESMFYAGPFHGKSAALCLESSMIGPFSSKKHTAILNSVEKEAFMQLMCPLYMYKNNQRVKYFSNHHTYYITYCSLVFMRLLYYHAGMQCTNIWLTSTNHPKRQYNKESILQITTV